MLGISEDSDQEQIRSAYLALVKKYHPDSGTDKANAEKFQEVLLLNVTLVCLINKYISFLD